MLEVELKYNGKVYSDWGQAFNDAAIDKIKDYILEKLEPFQDRIKREGGKVSFDFPGNVEDGGQLILSNMSTELCDEIQAAL